MNNLNRENITKETYETVVRPYQKNLIIQKVSVRYGSTITDGTNTRNFTYTASGNMATDDRTGISPGKVPGSYAVYEKQIDAAGQTVQYSKTVYDPEGNMISVKDKMTNGTIP